MVHRHFHARARTAAPLWLLARWARTLQLGHAQPDPPKAPRVFETRRPNAVQPVQQGGKPTRLPQNLRVARRNAQAHPDAAQPRHACNFRRLTCACACACSASCLHVYAHKGHWAAQRVLTHHSAPSANELALLQTHARRVSAVLIPIYRCAPCTAIAKHPPATSGVNRSGRANPTQISVWSIGSRSL